LAGSRKDSTMVDLFAEELQAARERAGLTAAELGAQVNYSGSQISMIETRRRIAPPGMAQRLDQALGTPGTFERMQRRLKAHIMLSQCEHLVEMSARPNVIMQVIPASTGVHDGLNGAFVIADFADAPSIAYLETAMTGMIVEQPGQVADLNVIYTGLNTEALPRAASIELIKEVAKEWTSS